MGLIAAARHVLKVRANTLLIASSASGYFFLAGIQTFGIEFAKDQTASTRSRLPQVGAPLPRPAHVPP
jgi:hypothetical protein